MPVVSVVVPSVEVGVDSAVVGGESSTAGAVRCVDVGCDLRFSVVVVLGRDVVVDVRAETLVDCDADSEGCCCC